jgi:haloalkane dehalogenase
MRLFRPLPDSVKRGFLFPYDSWANRIATHRFVRDIPQGVGAPNDKALAGIEQALPLLRERSVRIIWGGQDFCFNRHYFERWQGLIPNAVAEYLDEAGHYLIEDAQKSVVGQIERHITP